MEAKPYKIPHPFRKLNKKLIDILVADIAEGSTQRLAAESNGITNSIFYIWIAQGKVDIDHQEDSLCAYLVDSLAKVKKNEVKRCRQAIESSDKGHKGAEWTLEHAYWREFGKDANVKEIAEEIEKLRAEVKGASQDGNTNNNEAKQDSKE
jgi:hypothetical protein